MSAPAPRATRLSPEGMRRALAIASCTAETLGDAFLQVGLLAALYPHASPSQRARIRVAAEGLAGLVQRSRSQRTGTLVGVYRASEAGIDADLPYATVCEAHATCVSASTLAVARSSAVDPTEWCGPCRGEP